MTQPDWPARQARLIAEQVKRHRQVLGLSAQELAERTVQMGHPVTRNVIASLESGRRGTVSTADLLVLAFCLQMPPVELLFPVGHAETVEVLPGLNWPVWQAVAWLTGEASPDVGPEASPVQLYRKHFQYLGDWHDAVSRAAVFGSSEWGPERAGEVRYLIGQADFKARDREEALRMVRRDLRRRGLTVPELPPELAFLDEEENDR